MIEAGKKYRFYPDGGKTHNNSLYECLFADHQIILMRCGKTDFTHMPNTRCLQYYREFIEPKKGVKYMNITYHRSVGGYLGSTYNSRAAADEGVRSKDERIACIRVPWTEGQFDD